MTDKQQTLMICLFVVAALLWDSIPRWLEPDIDIEASEAKFRAFVIEFNNDLPELNAQIKANCEEAEIADYVCPVLEPFPIIEHEKGV